MAGKPLLVGNLSSSYKNAIELEKVTYKNQIILKY